MAKKIAGTYLAVLVVAFLAYLVRENGLVPVLLSVAWFFVLLTIIVAVIVLTSGED